VTLQTTEGALNRDFLFYYRLADNLPGRVEMVPYRPDPAKPGTFMLVLTPGIDLQPLTGGADYVYVLDKSGSMTGGKIAKLAQGVQKAIGAMRPEDRFRVIAFDSGAKEITAGWTPATPEKMRVVCEQVAALRADGSTDIHSGLKLALDSLDQDRATSIVLVTDGVANTGVVDPAAFDKLLRTYDVRVFGFVMGNSANWPLMDLIGRATGGFSCGVSNDDDIVGQIMLAKSKILHECLHDAGVRIEGVRTYDLTDGQIGKVYRGQQLVLFGRYEGSGRARVTLKAGLTGEDRTYTTEFDFPIADTGNPEIERLWALNQIEQAKRRAALGLLPDKERQDLERSLGVDYQLVTDETSMVVLSDDAFARRGIERRNQTRVVEERRAQSLRSARPVQSYRVDTSAPAFPSHAPSLGGGAGAIDPLGAAAAVAALLAVGRVLRGRARAS
jgi:Ca-activated chloride channel family protein